MQITDKQRKYLWVAGGILAVVYLGPSLINHIRMAFADTQASASSAKPSPVHIAPQTITVTAKSPLAGVDPQLQKLVGNWTGGAVLPDRGLCNLSVQIKPNSDTAGLFTGYSTMRCGPFIALTGHAVSAENRARAVANSLAPTSTIMTGTPAAGAIEFHVDKAIGVPVDGCPISSMTITPFAGNEVATEWKAGTCHGGNLILNRK
jgi:hypothetical protein